MLSKFDSCSEYVCGSAASSVQLLDRRSVSIAEEDGRIVLPFFLQSKDLQTSTTTKSFPYTADRTKVSIMPYLLREDDDMGNNNEISFFASESHYWCRYRPAAMVVGEFQILSDSGEAAAIRAVRTGHVSIYRGYQLTDRESD